MIPVLAAAVVALGVRFQDEEEQPKPVKLTEADYPKYLKLRFELGVVRLRAKITRNPKKLARIEAAKKKALEASGWSEAEFDRIHDKVSEIMSLLASIQDDPENKESYEEQLKELDATTVATVRAKRKELLELEKGEEDKIRERTTEAELPPPVDPKELPGTWVLDLDATCERLLDGVGGEEERKKVKEEFRKQIISSTYVFGSDKTIEVRTERPQGKVEVTKGTYRLDGRKLFVEEEGRKREIELTVGMEDGLLLVGMGFAQTAYKRQ